MKNVRSAIGKPVERCVLGRRIIWLTSDPVRTPTNTMLGCVASIRSKASRFVQNACHAFNSHARFCLYLANLARNKKPGIWGTLEVIA